MRCNLSMLKNTAPARMRSGYFWAYVMRGMRSGCEIVSMDFGGGETWFDAVESGCSDVYILAFGEEVQEPESLAELERIGETW